MPAAWVRHWVATKTASRTSVGRLLDRRDDSCSAEARGFVSRGIVLFFRGKPEIVCQDVRRKGCCGNLRVVRFGV